MTMTANTTNVILPVVVLPLYLHDDPRPWNLHTPFIAASGKTGSEYGLTAINQESTRARSWSSCPAALLQAYFFTGDK